MYSVDIVIPTYMRADLIERCLVSLSNIELPDNLETVIVVENGPKQGVEGVVDKLSHSLPLKYMYLEEGNISLARNCGINESKADFIIFFDNDVTFRKGTVAAYIDAFEKYGTNYFYGGALEPDYECEPESWLKQFLPPTAKGFDLGDELKVISKSSFLGPNHAFYRKHLVDNGCYDVNGAQGFNSGPVGEETRMQKKLLKQGVEGVYIPGAFVYHDVPINNCSISWVLKRANRHGQTQAIEEKPGIKKNRLLSVPYFHWVRMLKLIIRFMFRYITSSSKTEIFQLRYDLHYQLGVFKGYREG